MGSCLNHITTFLFFFLFLFGNLHVHARERKFFSKVTNHISVTSKTSASQLEDPLGVPPAAAPALSPVSGLEGLVYHSGSNGVPSARETDLADGTSADEFEGQISGEEIPRESFRKGYGYSNNVNYNGKVNARSAGAFSSGEVYPAESQQGMSDTRYLENGRYFYSLKGDNSYGNAYKTEEQNNVDENGSGAYEFDTMEEYYRKQGIPDPLDQGVYVP